MSFLSGLKVFGTEIEKAFSWFGGPAGKAIIGTAETLVEDALPVSIPAIDLLNAWAQKAYQVESLAAAAGKATGTGADKAALVDQAIAPLLIQYANAAGVSTRTTAQITAANDALIAFLNAMTEEPATSGTSATVTVGATTA